MRPKSLILLVLALGCGLVASIGINQVMANKRGPVAAAVDTVPIYVAQAEIGLGDPLLVEALKLEQWPKDRVPPGAIGKLEDIQDRRTKTKFFPGEPILEPKLFGKGENQDSVSEMIPKGYRVVAVRVDAVSSGGNMLLAGDRVDVMVHLQENPSKGIMETGTRTFLQNIKVFAVNDQFSRDGEEKSLAAKTVSLLVTPPQAEIVTLASELGQIRLSMRSVDDDGVETSGGANADLLTNGAGKGEDKTAGLKEALTGDASPDLLDLLNKPAPQPEPVVVATASPGWRMIVLAGTDAREVRFSEDGGLGEVTSSLSGAGNTTTDTTTTDSTGTDSGSGEDATSEEGGQADTSGDDSNDE
jgi:pilus assembly protein CpaB